MLRKLGTSMRAAYYEEVLGPRIGVEFAKLESEFLSDRADRDRALEWISQLAPDDRLMGIYLVRTKFLLRRERDLALKKITQKNRLLSKLEYANSAGSDVGHVELTQLKADYSQACEVVEGLKASMMSREQLFRLDLQMFAKPHVIPDWLTTP